MRAIAPPQGSQKRADNVPKPGGGGVHPTLAYCNPTAAAAAPAKAEPSWGRVLATTIKLATSRRLRSPGFGPPATARQQGRNWFRWDRRHLRQLAARRWRLTGLLLLGSGGRHVRRRSVHGRHRRHRLPCRANPGLRQSARRQRRSRRPSRQVRLGCRGGRTVRLRCAEPAGAAHTGPGSRCSAHASARPRIAGASRWGGHKSDER